VPRCLVGHGTSTMNQFLLPRDLFQESRHELSIPETKLNCANWKVTFIDPDDLRRDSFFPLLTDWCFQGSFHNWLCASSAAIVTAVLELPDEISIWCFVQLKRATEFPMPRKWHIDSEWSIAAWSGTWPRSFDESLSQGTKFGANNHDQSNQKKERKKK
jgi:hypothetical protein